MNGLQGKSLFTVSGMCTNAVRQKDSWSRPVNHFKSCLNRAAQSLGDTPKYPKRCSNNFGEQTNCSANPRQWNTSNPLRNTKRKAVIAKDIIFLNRQVTPKSDEFPREFELKNCLAGQVFESNFNSDNLLKILRLDLA